MIFVDASAWYAAVDERDLNQKRAKEYLEIAISAKEEIITTNWVAYEAYSLLKGRRNYTLARTLKGIIENPETVELYWIDPLIEASALEIFWNYQDKKWGVVDCASLVVMDIAGCDCALAYDSHFQLKTKNRLQLFPNPDSVSLYQK